jgi:ubiquinone/menaquinone biosynthesis C-methylase UbiE
MIASASASASAPTGVRPTPAEIRETIYRLDGPLRWALGEARTLLRRVDVRPGAALLDVGAGTGYLSLTLARAIGDAGAVHCLDPCPELLDVLADKADRDGLSDRIVVDEGSAASMPYPDQSFDHVFSGYALHELASCAQQSLAEAHRVLRPHGAIVIADFRRLPDASRTREIERWYAAHADGGGGGERHLRFSLADVELMLAEAGFRDIELATWHDFHMHVVAHKG